MKKLFAILLAAMLMISCCAFAEPAVTEDVDAAQAEVDAGTYYWFGSEEGNYMLALNGELNIVESDDPSVSYFVNDAQTLYVQISMVEATQTLEEMAATEGTQYNEEGDIPFVYASSEEEGYNLFVLGFIGADGYEYDLVIGYDTNDEAAVTDAQIMVGSLTTYDASQIAA